MVSPQGVVVLLQPGVLSLNRLASIVPSAFKQTPSGISLQPGYLSMIICSNVSIASTGRLCDCTLHAVYCRAASAAVVTITTSSQTQQLYQLAASEASLTSSLEVGHVAATIYGCIIRPANPNVAYTTLNVMVSIQPCNIKHKLQCILENMAADLASRGDVSGKSQNLEDVDDSLAYFSVNAALEKEYHNAKEVVDIVKWIPSGCKGCKNGTLLKVAHTMQPICHSQGTAVHAQPQMHIAVHKQPSL